MYCLQNQILCYCFNLTSQIFNRHFNKVDGQERQRNPHLLSTECVLSLLLYLSYCVAPLIHAVVSFVYP